MMSVTVNTWFFIAWALAWLAGVFFGMGLESKLFQ